MSIERDSPCMCEHLCLFMRHTPSREGVSQKAHSGKQGLHVTPLVSDLVEV